VNIYEHTTAQTQTFFNTGSTNIRNGFSLVSNFQWPHMVKLDLQER